jgi:hypothetical protein
MRPIFAQYLKRGFFMSSYTLNGEMGITSEEHALQIIEWFEQEFERLFEQNLEDDIKLLSELKGLKPSLNQKPLVENMDKLPSSDLDKKILASCRLCNRTIYNNDVDLSQIDKSKINNFPFPYIHIHSNNGDKPHGLIMYLDAQMKVRGRTPTKFVKIDGH